LIYYCLDGVQLWFDYQSQWVEKVSKSAENAALIDSLSFMQYGNTVTLTIEGWDCVSEPAIISIEGFMYAASGSQQQDSVNDQLLTIPNNFRMASIGDGAIPVPVKRYYIESML
jgi:hypothetical protein